MVEGKRQFDRNKYLNSPHAEPTPAQAARMERARERALRMRPLAFWTRAVASLVITVALWAVIGWMADWPAPRTGIWIVVSMVAWTEGILLAHSARKQRP